MIGGVPAPTVARFGSSTGCRLSATLFTQLRVHVADGREIGGARPRVELAEQRVVALLLLELRDTARRIVDVAEDDRVSGARLLTGGLHLAVANRPLVLLRFDLRVVDA